HVAPWRKAPFLVEHDAYAPGPSRDELSAAAAGGLTAGRSFRSIYAGKAFAGCRSLRRNFEHLATWNLGVRRQGLQKGLRALVCGAQRMEPKRHIAVAKEIGK